MDLLETLIDLNIETGHLTKNAISAWCDTDSEDDIYLLNWLCNLNKSNILSPLEKQEHDLILKTNSFINSEEDCEKQLNDVLLEYPSLLNIDDNLLDIQLLETEIEKLLEEETKQEMLISKSRQVSEDLSRDNTELSSRADEISHEKNKRVETCIQLSIDLDNLNLHLATVLKKLQVSLYNFQHAQLSSFFSNIDLVPPYIALTDTIISSVNMYIKENSENVEQNSTLSSSLFLDCQGDFNDELYVLKERIYHSTLNYLHKQVDEKCLMAELEYLKNYTTSFDINSSSYLECNIDGYCYEAKNKIDLMNIQLENYANKLSFKYISGPEINRIMDKLDWNQRRLDKTLSLKEALLKILRYQEIIGLIYKIEQEEVISTDKLFTEVTSYTREDLKGYEIRMHKILDTTNFCSSLEPKENNFVRCISSLLSNEVVNLSFTDAITAIQSLRTERKLVLKQLHSGDLNAFIDIYKERNANNAVMFNYLKSSPVSKITIIPHQLLHLFTEIDGLLAVQKKQLMETIDTQKFVQTKLDKDKWLRYRRQLWMYFLKNQNKMLMFIDEIQLHLKQLNKVG